MALPKLFDRIFWHDNTTPAINEDNLNSMSKAIDDIDDRVIDLAGTIMEDVPQIIEDMAILEPAIESIDENVARAEAAAESAEQYAEEIAPPIEVVKDYADIITVEDAINKPVKDLKVKVDPVQDLHGYTKPWVGGAGKQKIPLTVARIKATEQDASFVGDTLTVKGIIFTLITDAAGNLTKIHIEKTSSFAGTAFINLAEGVVLSGDYLASGGINANAFVRVGEGDSATGSGAQIAKPVGADVPFTADPTKYYAFAIGITNDFTGSADMYPMIRLASVSDATFEPYTNICPITGHSEANLTRAGHNLAPVNATSQTTNGVQITVNADKTITLANTATATGSVNLTNYFTLPAGSYTLSKQTTTGSAEIYLTTGSAEVADLPKNSASVSFTLTKATTMQMRFYLVNGTAYSATVYPMIRLATDTNTTYEPYMGEIYTIDLDGTRYGGVLDVDAGALTLTYGYKNLGDLTWNYSEVSSTRPYGSFITSSVTDRKTGSNVNALCSNYSFGTNFSTDKRIVLHGSAVDVYVIDSAYNDSTTFTNAMDGVQLVYELATPQTIQLTAEEVTLLWAYNTLFADTGDLSLTYDASGVLRIANAKLDIDTFKSVVAASSDFADFKTRVAAL